MFLKIKSQNSAFPARKRRTLTKRWFFFVPLLGASLWLGYQQLSKQLRPPEAIFVLGGDEQRERFAAQLAAKKPNLPVWVSSGSPQGYAQRIFAKAGIEQERLHLDYQARDTVTNFTTLVDELKSQGIDSVYLVTSDSHMNRARLIGEIVFGSRGIAIKPLAVPSPSPPESTPKCLRDGARAVLWLVTGRTGETLFPARAAREAVNKISPIKWR